MKNHPMQEIGKDVAGCHRFRPNEIVKYLLDSSFVGMNGLAVRDFSAADRKQFAMLIGYSVSGFGSLSYVDDVTYEAAVTMGDTEKTELVARLEYLEETIKVLKDGIRGPMARLFEVHPDDLSDGE